MKTINWLPIETAPKDRDVLLYLGSGQCSVGKFDHDGFARRPRPYWSTERGWLFGKLWQRENQPTHWAELTRPETGVEAAP